MAAGNTTSHWKKYYLPAKPRRIRIAWQVKTRAPPNVLFYIEDVNAMLKNYSDEWDEIYSGTEEDIEDLDDENDIAGFDERRPSEYERVKHLKSPQDLLNDELERQGMEDWVDDALADESSAEYNTFRRLVNQGHSEDESRTMIFEALSIEFFYDLKYGTGHFNDRYQYNLDRLPEIRPVEIPSLDFAVEVLDKCTKGIPFSAIDYLHNDIPPSPHLPLSKHLTTFQIVSIPGRIVSLPLSGIPLRLKAIYASN